MRVSLVSFQADGSKDKVRRCSHQEAPKANQDVTPQDCSDCPVRRELVVAERTARPPRKLPDNTPILSRRPDNPASEGFPTCVDRLLVVIPSCCGKTTNRLLCDSPDSPKYQGEVTPAICNQCTVKRT